MMRRLVRSMLVAGLVLGAAGPAPGQVKLPEIGDSSGGVLSNIDDRLLGEAFLREIRAHLNLIDDPEITGYVSRLGDRLAQASGEGGRGFRFFVVGSATVNAFAGPGGIVAINTGLIELADTESELAAVMAHEIAHVTQRHLARSIQSAGKAALPRLAGILAALVLSTQNAEAGQAALAAVLAGSAQQQLNFTRANEKEADRVGIRILADAGLDPRAMPSFFERMALSSRYESRPPEFLSTHPVTVNRVADSRSRAEQYGYRQFKVSENFYLVKARIRALKAKDPRKLAATMRAELERGQYRNELAIRYGLTIALMRAKRWRDAERQLSGLLERRPEHIPFLIARAETEHGLGNDRGALELLRTTLANYPNDTALVKSYGNLLLQLGASSRALSVLVSYARTRRPDSTIYHLLARAYSRLGRPLESNLALAEQQYLNGNLDAAIRQLAVALRKFPSRDSVASQLQARLSELRAEAKLRKDL